LKTNKFTGLFLLFAVFAALLALAGCPQEEETDPVPPMQHGPWGNPPYTNTISDSAFTVILNEQGEPVNGTVAITLTLVNGIITDVSFAGTNGQTDGIGSVMIDRAPALIKEKNSMDITMPDGISRCTITLNAIKEAGGKALGKIPGVK
jgi:hypothetical protein